MKVDDCTYSNHLKIFAGVLWKLQNVVMHLRAERLELMAGMTKLIVNIILSYDDLTTAYI